MLGSILDKIVHDGLQSLATGRRMQFDPSPLFRAVNMDAAAKNKMRRNIMMFQNSARYKTLMKQLEKEFMLALMK